jgi:hypothetical protein
MRFTETARSLWSFAPIWRAAVLTACSFTFLATIYPPVGAPSLSGMQLGANYTPVPMPQQTNPQPTAGVANPVPQAHSARFGEIANATIAFAGRSVPLPAGRWRVVASLPNTRPDGVIIDAIAAAREDDGTVRAIVLLVANNTATPSPTPFRADGNCDRSDLIFTHIVKNQDLGDQDCQTVDFVSVDGALKQGADVLLRAALGELQQSHIALPSTLVSANFRFGDSRSILLARYYFNPDAAGVSASTKSQWQESDWNKYNLARHPDKQTYVTNVIAWVDGWGAILRPVWKLDPDVAQIDDRSRQLPH